MQLLEKKVKCPLCGAKNQKDARRCAICTRPLANDPLPSQAVYDEALWSTKIATKRSRQRTNPYLLLVTAVAVALLANYFVLGYGPSWAHEPDAARSSRATLSIEPADSTLRIVPWSFLASAARSSTIAW